MPVAAEACQEGLDVILINGKVAFQERREAMLLLMAFQDGGGIRKEDLGIGDNSGRQECMGGAAVGAANPANTKAQEGVPHLDGTQISPMPDEAGTMAAGTGKLVELDGADQFIIKILRKGVAKFVLNGYHNRCPCGASRRWLWAGTKLWSVGFLPIFMLQRDMIP